MPPYLPFTEALRQYVNGCLTADLRTHWAVALPRSRFLSPS